MQKFFIPIRDMSAKYTVMQQSMAATERVFQLLDNGEVEDVQLNTEPTERTEKGNRKGSASELVEFDDVSFHYTEGQPVLEGLSFSVSRGESVAVVGATGAGKSTLVRVLTRLYEVVGGRVLLGGADLRGMALDQIRRRVVVVNQDVFLFAGTVADNISLGAPELTTEQIADAARRVGLTRLLELDHEVLERGANLSAGEQQLVAFARALARDPEVLVLDEATASVDPESERVIQDGIAELTRERTSIIIAHRLTTIEQVDRVLVLRRGRLEEQGSHDELLAAGGLYSRLYDLQYVPPRST